MSAREGLEQVINDRIVCDPMWIGDDGQPLDYLPDRELLIGEFIREVTTDIIGRWLPGALADERVVEAAAEAIWPDVGMTVAHEIASAALTAAVTALREEPEHG